MNIIVSGLGAVGRAFIKLYLHQKIDATIVAVGDSTGFLAKEKGLSLEDLEMVISAKAQGKGLAEVFTIRKTNAKELIPELLPDVLIELTPTNFDSGEPSLSNILFALENNVHVVTSVKSHTKTQEDYLNVIDTAKKNNLCFFDDASVMGGVPITEALKGIGSDFIEVKGILNGSTNFVLSQMEEGMGFDEAVLLAREKGFLEKDAANDLEGHDPAGKLCNLANKMGFSLKKSDVVLEKYQDKLGILGVSKEKIDELKLYGKSVRLIALIKNNDGKVEASVGVKEIPSGHFLALTKGPLNALSMKLKANQTEYELFFQGPGAGGDVTATRVIAGLKRVLFR